MRASAKGGVSYLIRTRYLLAQDALIVIVAFGASVLLRLESLPDTRELIVANWPVLAAALCLRLPIYLGLGLYTRLWRYASIREVIRILYAGVAGSAAVLLANFIVFPLFGLTPLRSGSIFVLDFLLNVGLLSLSRLFLRIGLVWLVRRDSRQVLAALTRRRNVLIAGAGGVGALVSRLLQDNPQMGMSVVGHVDDDPEKQGKYLHGFPVLGTRNDIRRLVAEKGVAEVIIAMPTVEQPVIDEVSRICAQAAIPTRVIPSLYDLLSGTLSVNQMRQWRSLDAMPRDGRAAAVSETDGFHRVLVTGGAGFIGTNFVRYMLDAYPDYRIIVLDKLTYAGNPDNLLGLPERYGERYAFVQGDICDYETVAQTIERYEADAIVHFAAESHVDRSLIEPNTFLSTNVYGTYTLLEASRCLGIKRFHQVSTDEVYGQALRGSFSEDDPLETRSPYSASKAAADLLVHAYFVSFGVQATITRGSNNIGPYQYPEKAVPLFVTNAMDNLPLPVYGDGCYVRDYQYVLDHCRAIDLVLHRGVPGQIYNTGGGSEVASMELAERIVDALGKPRSLIRLVDDRPGQDRRYSLNCSKIRELGWVPQWNFDRALDTTIQWYVENEWWWRKIKSGEYRQYYEKQFSKRLESRVQAALSGIDGA